MIYPPFLHEFEKTSGVKTGRFLPLSLDGKDGFMKRAVLTMISPDITLIDDAGDSTCYLVAGNDKAVLIDTANGKENLKEIICALTDLPLVVINTHGHCDHIYGNLFFDEAYIHDADLPVMAEHFARPEAVKLIEQTGLKPCPTKSIRQGDVIDLGGKKLEIYEVPGHTPGSIVLLDRDERVLFTGDALNGHLWMQLEESTGIPSLIRSIKALEPIRGAFDYILTGHAKGLEDASLIDELLSGAQELLDGKTENDSDYEWFCGIARRHDYGTHGRCIVYDEKKM